MKAQKLPVSKKHHNSAQLLLSDINSSKNELNQFQGLLKIGMIEDQENFSFYTAGFVSPLALLSLFFGCPFSNS